MESAPSARSWAGLLYRHRCLHPAGVVGREELPVEPLAADTPVLAGLAVAHVPGQGEEHGLAADGVGSPHVPLPGGAGPVAGELDDAGGEVMFGESDLLGHGVEKAVDGFQPLVPPEWASVKHAVLGKQADHAVCVVAVVEVPGELHGDLGNLIEVF